MLSFDLDLGLGLAVPCLDLVHCGLVIITVVHRLCRKPVFDSFTARSVFFILFRFSSHSERQENFIYIVFEVERKK